MWNMIHTVISSASAPERLGLLHQIQPIANIPVFQCFLPQLGSRQRTYLWIQMYQMILTGDINGISTLDATFPDLSYRWLTGYSTVDKQSSQKINNLPQQSVLLHNVKPIAKRLVFLCLPLTFSQFLPLIWVTTKILQGIPPLRSLFSLVNKIMR